MCMCMCVPVHVYGILCTCVCVLSLCEFKNLAPKVSKGPFTIHGRGSRRFCPAAPARIKRPTPKGKKMIKFYFSLKMCTFFPILASGFL